MADSDTADPEPFEPRELSGLPAEQAPGVLRDYDTPDSGLLDEAKFGIQPWRRMAGEPSLWHGRFKRYCHMGTNRQALRIYNGERKKNGKGTTNALPGGWKLAMERWYWDLRAVAYDDNLRDLLEARFRKRQMELVEREWTTALELIDKAAQMLKFPLATTTQETITEGGKTVITTTIHPTRWTFRDAAAILDVGDKLARLSTGMITSHGATEHTGKDGSPLELDSEHVLIMMPDNGRDGYANKTPQQRDAERTAASIVDNIPADSGDDT